MADADEDAISRPGATVDEDIDLSDETQDFRFLAAIGNDGGKIPKRGEKDFEPHATALQSDTLAASRLAMHNALSVQRFHQPKGHTIATYHPETNMVYSQNPKGVWVAKMGQVLSANEDPFGNDEFRGQRLWLLPEEALYLIERGTIDLRWPSEDTSGEPGLPMSLQAAYAMLIGDETSHNGGLTFERYSVYAALRRGGYTIVRAPSWNGPGPPIDRDCYPPDIRRAWSIGLSSFLTWTAGRTIQSSHKASLVQPGLYRSYAEVYRRLALIPFYDPTSEKWSEALQSPETDEHFRITYHVYKPSNTKYRKTVPGPPDFRIAVVDARETGLPTMDQLSKLISTVPYDSPADSPHFYAKLKHGYKNVILAVVDQGVTSYLRLADAAFGKEKLYEREFKGPGSKRGGYKGRGRGR